MESSPGYGKDPTGAPRCVPHALIRDVSRIFIQSLPCLLSLSWAVRINPQTGRDVSRLSETLSRSDPKCPTVPLIWARELDSFRLHSVSTPSHPGLL